MNGREILPCIFVGFASTSSTPSYDSYGLIAYSLPFLCFCTTLARASIQPWSTLIRRVAGSRQFLNASLFYPTFVTTFPPALIDRSMWLWSVGMNGDGGFTLFFAHCALSSMRASSFSTFCPISHQASTSGRDWLNGGARHWQGRIMSFQFTSSLSSLLVSCSCRQQLYG